MSATRFRVDYRSMPTKTIRRITVELEAGADPIRGSIARMNGRRQPFWGWLELIEELRRVAFGERPGERTAPSSDKRKEAVE